MTRQRYAFAIAGALLAFSSADAGAQAWPTRPILAVIPFSAGNANDVVGRVVLDQLSQQLGTVPTHDVPPLGATHLDALGATEHLVWPIEFVRQRDQRRPADWT